MDDSLLYALTIITVAQRELTTLVAEAKKGKSIANKLRTLRLILAEGRKEVENAIVNSEFKDMTKGLEDGKN